MGHSVVKHFCVLEQWILDRDVPQNDVFVEGAFLAHTVDVVQGVEPRPHYAAGATSGESKVGPEVARFNL